MATFIPAARRWLDERGPLLGIVAVLGAALAGGIYVLGAAQGPLLAWAAAMPVVVVALIATTITALCTGVGALPALFTSRVSDRAQNAMLGFSAGIMLAASIFSLVLPSLEEGAALTGSALGGGVIAAAGIAAGSLLMLAMDRWVPHEHRIMGRMGSEKRQVSRVWLFIFAITLHNIPEGLAVGVAFAGDDIARALPLAVGIAVQNMPEGLAVALALLTLNYTPGRAVLIALATGLVEPLGGVAGAAIFSLAQAMLPFGLALAAGAMLFVISHEIIPETHHNKGHETVATGGIMGGFVVMMLFDTALSSLG